MYRLTFDPNVVLRDVDGASIPLSGGNPAGEEYKRWLAAGNIPAPYFPPAAPVPAEVPRWAGRLALKRHVLQGGALVLLGAADARADNLLAGALAWRATLPEGELADRVDAALHDAKDWLRGSETVGVLAAVLGLTDDHVDQLFFWADEQEV